jgi:hypothetical protein
MRKTKKFAAVMAVALGVGIAPYANAVIEHHPGGRGDALLFPVFYGNGENYFTVSNSSNVFIQGHIRFRGAVWSGELLDFDVILTPGDVFVFRLADVDGDGFWEIDQSIDPANFEYTGMLTNCGPDSSTGVSKDRCMDQSNLLIPSPTDKDTPSGAITDTLIAQHRTLGYVEFIGEGVLNGMTHPRMSDLLDPKFAGQRANLGQRATPPNKTGTSLWSWVLATGNGRLADSDTGSRYDTTPAGQADASTLYTAGDVPNALSGTAFITQVGQKHGIAYNAEALVNFRTNYYNHRVDNYKTVVNMNKVFGNAGPQQQIGVILHNENASAPAGDFTYVYGYLETGSQSEKETTNSQESRISFNNTWGPTLADGDDYSCVGGIPSNEFLELANLRWVTVTPNSICGGNGKDTGWDSWDDSWKGPNSIAEVEEAIRDAVPNYPNDNFYPVDSTDTPDGSSPRQLFTSFYFDNATFDKACEGNGRQDNPACSNTTLQSWYFAFFPTKFFYGEDLTYWKNVQNAVANPGANTTDQLLGKRGYLHAAVEHLLTWAKPLRVGLWDIFENYPGVSTCDKSPCIPGATQGLALREELAVFSIKDIKARFTGSTHQGWQMGRTSLQVEPAANVCRDGVPQGNNCVVTYPALMYTFDWGSDGYLSHWRPLER